MKSLMIYICRGKINHHRNEKDLIAVPGVFLANSSYLRDFFKLHEVPVYLETAVDSITEEGVIIKRKDGSKEVIQGDDVIMSVGYLPSPLENSGKLPLVGDCKRLEIFVRLFGVRGMLQ